mgnify:FL=1
MTLNIPEFYKANVLVVGDVMLDRYVFGMSSRISPEAPVPVVLEEKTEERPGGAANVALNLASLGVKTTLVGIVGIDEAGKKVESMLEDSSISCDLERDKEWVTITKTRIQSRGQQLLRIDRETYPNANKTSLLNLSKKYLSSVDVVILSDYGKGSLVDVSNIIKSCKVAGVPVLVDPKGINFEKYSGASLLTPNQMEFEAIVGVCNTDDELVEKSRRIINELNLGALLITRSEKGMLLVESDKDPLFLETKAQEVYDVAGAGDTVIATIASSLARQNNLGSAAKLANLAASLVVRKIGVASIEPSELRNEIIRLNKDKHGIISASDISKTINEAKSRSEKIVMTNGCFDFIHAGHVAYLQEAKHLGDRLVVAVNDDNSVRRLKGDKRPINKLEDRMIVLAGLSSVDWVVAFSEDTPVNIITLLMPDILVKGGNYDVKDIVGANEVLKNGGEVKTLLFRDGLSSSKIIEEID